MAKKEAFPVVFLDLDDRDFRRLPARVEKKAEKAVKQTTLLIEAAAVRKAPRKTGNLQNSGTSGFSGSGFNIVGEVKFTAKYAIFVHEGTGIFGPEQREIEIFPRGKKALFWPGAAHPVKRVRQKGIRGRPFLKAAFEEEQPKLAKRIFE